VPFGYTLPDQRCQHHGRREQEESHQGVDRYGVLDGEDHRQHTDLERAQGRRRTDPDYGTIRRNASAPRARFAPR